MVSFLEICREVAEAVAIDLEVRFEAIRAAALGG